jgi:hypothetical protein
VTKGSATLATPALLLAAAAFVIDVVSPFSPTPNAAFAKSVVLMCVGLLASTFACDLSATFGEKFNRTRKELRLTPVRPPLIALTCVLLC